MKIDKFNEIIKRKLLGAEPPPYHEADWERMSAFMQSKHPPSFWQQYSQTFWYGSGIAAIVGLLIINLKQLNDNKRLLQEIKVIGQQKIATAASLKKDTVFMMRYRNQSAINQTSHVAHAPFESNDRIVQNNPYNVADLDKPTATNDNIDIELQSKRKAQIWSKYTNGAKAQNPNNVDGSTIASKRVESQKQNGAKAQNPYDVIGSTTASKQAVSQNETNGVLVKKNTKTRTDIVASKNAPTVATVENNSAINIELLVPTELADLQTELADGVKNKKLRIRTPDEMTWPSEPKKTKPVRLATPPIRVQIGGSGTLENRLVGTGLSAEVLIGKRWSVNIGLDAVKIRGEQFLSDEQFNQKYKQDFRRLYAPPQLIPATADILNINSSLQLVQLPVFVSYRYPLQKEFTLLLSAGSVFDLSVKENISFNFRPNRQDFATETRNEARDIPVFNNVFGGLGIEKRWNRFAVQAQPYIEVKIAKMKLPNHEDRESHPQMGVRLRALYRFGK
jgi:hypothetical protein